MDTSKERSSDAGGDTEDIPSDFFDELTNDEFIEGLSVVDTWDFAKEKMMPTKEISPAESEKDLRDLISEIKRRPFSRGSVENHSSNEEGGTPSLPRSGSRLSDFIKPGSRRDRNKTNEAIRRDKEEKVKIYLAKHLEDDLRPPGTELDDYYNEDVSLKPAEKKLPVVEENTEQSTTKRKERRTPKKRRSPRKNPGRSPRRLHHSPNSRPSHRYSPHRSSRRSPIRRSPQRRSPVWRNSSRRTRRSRSPRPSRRSRSPRPSRRSRSPILYRRSRSPRRRESRRSRSKSVGRVDHFMYPNPTNSAYPPSNIPYSTAPQYAGLSIPEFMVPQEPVYSGSYSSGYDYGGQLMAMSAPIGSVGPPLGHAVAPGMEMAIPQPMPSMAPFPDPSVVPTPMQSIPSMVPAPQVIPPQLLPPSKQLVEYSSPYDGLAKLYADGKISKEDYLKLAPNKGASQSMDTQTRVKVLNRCNTMVTKLSKLLLPRRLVVNMKAIGPEQKCLPLNHCSPLKRHPTIDFNYTTHNSSTIQQRNKKLVDTIISTLGLESIIPRAKSVKKNMKDAETQTSKIYCDVCEIREYTKLNEASTSVDPEHFSSSTHTQVIEAELLNSRAVFNPSGSIGDGATMSIAHMTPAQLVSQLAARAKTLKQSDGDQTAQFNRRNQSNNHDYGGRGGGSSGGQQYHNYYRY